MIKKCVLLSFAFLFSTVAISDIEEEIAQVEGLFQEDITEEEAQTAFLDILRKFNRQEHTPPELVMIGHFVALVHHSYMCDLRSNYDDRIDDFEDILWETLQMARSYFPLGGELTEVACSLMQSVHLYEEEEQIEEEIILGILSILTNGVPNNLTDEACNEWLFLMSDLLNSFFKNPGLVDINIEEVINSASELQLRLIDLDFRNNITEDAFYNLELALFNFLPEPSDSDESIDPDASSESTGWSHL